MFILVFYKIHYSVQHKFKVIYGGIKNKYNDI